MSPNRARFLSAWQPWFLRRSRRAALRPQPTGVPSTELLEDRWLPSLSTVLNPNTASELPDQPAARGGVR